MSRLIVGIQGMTCANCSNTITDMLKKQDGIDDVSVSLITDEAEILFNNAKINSGKIIEVIEDIGFDAHVIQESKSENILQTRLAIEGMTCGSCSATITTMVEKIPDVKSVSVSLITNEAMIEHKSSVSVEEIINQIEECGFGAKLQNSDLINNNNLMVSSRFAIKGMTCTACSTSIVNALKDSNGVDEAEVSLITEEAFVKYNLQKISQDELEDKINDCGFEASLIETKQIDDDDDNEEQVIFQIFGLKSEADLSSFQYNLEALAASLNLAIINYKLDIDSHLKDSMDVNGDAGTSLLQSRSSNDSEVMIDDGILVNKVTMTYDSSILGVRDLVDRLHAMNDEGISLLILNSVDQSSNSQLNLLSKVKDIQYWKNNFIRALVLGIPVIVLNRCQNLSFWKSKMLFSGFYWVTLIEGILASYIQFKLGIVFLKKFRQFIRSNFKNATMDVLVCISTMISYTFSIISTCISVWNGQTDNPPTVLFDTSAMLVTFVSFGKWLENRAKGATSTALSKLVSLTPAKCVIVTNYEEYESYIMASKQEKIDDINTKEFSTKEIPIDLIQRNDISIVFPGTRIPADGTIIYGESDIDESLLTGESLPVYKKVGDQVIGGSINGPDILHVKVEKCGKNSQLQKIIKLVKESQINKAPIQRYSDYIAGMFVPTILLLACVTFIFWLVICLMTHTDMNLPKAFQMDNNGKLFVCLKLGISVVVVACPCALGLAAPTAVMVGTGLGAENGVLIKGGDILERASDLDIILFDKTGTLTTGEMNLINYTMNKKIDKSIWWKLIGGTELNSEHPVGRALVRIAKSQLNLFPEDSLGLVVQKFDVLTGLGVRATLVIDNQEFNAFIGNRTLIQNQKPDIELIDNENTTVHVLVNDEYYGNVELTDELKPNSKKIINYLKFEKNYIIGMVTGDNSKIANKIGQDLGIIPNNVFSEVTPANKDKVIASFKERYGGNTNVKVAFVGDGINDAPALSRADVGIAISHGNDIAIESANIVLMNNENNDLYGVPVALDLSQKTFRRIKLNFVWAMIYNIIMIPFAMGCFLPLNIMLPPMAAGLSMAFSSVSVVLSSLALKNYSSVKIKEYNKKVDYEAYQDFDLKNSNMRDFINHKKKIKWSR